MSAPRILIVGTVDTKSDEIGFMAEQVRAAGGQPLVIRREEVDFMCDVLEGAFAAVQEGRA